MSAVLTQQEVKKLDELKKQLIEILSDYWDSQIFLGDTEELQRFAAHLKRFFTLEIKPQEGKKEAT